MFPDEGPFIPSFELQDDLHGSEAGQQGSSAVMEQTAEANRGRSEWVEGMMQEETSEGLVIAAVEGGVTSLEDMMTEEGTVEMNGVQGRTTWEEGMMSGMAGMHQDADRKVQMQGGVEMASGLANVSQELERKGIQSTTQMRGVVGMNQDTERKQVQMVPRVRRVVSTNQETEGKGVHRTMAQMRVTAAAAVPSATSEDIKHQILVSDGLMVKDGTGTLIQFKESSSSSSSEAIKRERLAESMQQMVTNGVPSGIKEEIEVSQRITFSCFFTVENP